MKLIFELYINSRKQQMFGFGDKTKISKIKIKLIMKFYIYIFIFNFYNFLLRKLSYRIFLYNLKFSF